MSLFPRISLGAKTKSGSAAAKRGAPKLELLEDAKAHVVGAALTRVDAKVHARSGFADAEVYHPRYGAYFRE